jgi:hypothetical protein
MSSSSSDPYEIDPVEIEEYSSGEPLRFIRGDELSLTEYGPPKIQTEGGTAGAAVGTVTQSVSFIPTPKPPQIAQRDHRADHHQHHHHAADHGQRLRVRPRHGRAGRERCNFHTEGSRRGAEGSRSPPSGDDDPHEDDDPDHRADLVPAPLGRSG